MQEPPVRTVRKFLHLLEHSDADFEEELGNRTPAPELNSVREKEVGFVGLFIQSCIAYSLSGSFVVRQKSRGCAPKW